MNIQVKMKSIITLSMIAFGTLLSGSAAYADEQADIERVRAELIKMIPLVAQSEIIVSPANAVYRIEVQGNYAYAYVDGDYVLLGDLYNIKEQVNLGERASAERMAGLIKDVPTSKMIVYGPEAPKRYITVFTDIDCGYCQKLHREVPQLNEAGIQVRYLAFPRAGVGSKSHKKYVSVWCNADQQTALTSAKAGKSVVTASCDNPVEESYNLGREVGVRGTPTIMFDDGTVIPGYKPYTELIKLLDLES